MMISRVSRIAVIPLVAIALAFSLSAMAYADVHTDIDEVSGKATAITIDEYLSDGNSIVPTFFGADGNELPIALERIDPLDEGNMIDFYGVAKLPYFGLAAYAANVEVPRDTMATIVVENFLPGVSFREAVPESLDDVRNSQSFVNPENGLGLFDKIEKDSTFGYLKGSGDELHPVCMSNGDKYYDLARGYLLTEEFFNDSYVFKVDVDGRTSFDESYLLNLPNSCTNIVAVQNEIGSNFYGSINKTWNMFIYFTYAEDKDAADKIAALPEADAVTLEHAGQIAEARAAYDLLAQWEGAQEAIDPAKLIAAENRLAELQEQAAKEAAIAELDQAIAAAKAIDQSKLTDDQKKALNDAVAAAEAAKASGEATAETIAAAKEAIAAATATAEQQVKDAEEAANTPAAKAKQTIKVKTKAKTFKAKKLAKKAQSFKIGATAKTKLTYKVTQKNKRIKFKNGKVTVKKGTKKGTYRIKVKITAKATDAYKSATKTVTITVKVKK